MERTIQQKILHYNILLYTGCHISSRKIINEHSMFLLPVVIYSHISDKLVIALWPATILANIFTFLILCFYFTRLKARQINRK